MVHLDHIKIHLPPQRHPTLTNLHIFTSAQRTQHTGTAFRWSVTLATLVRVVDPDPPWDVYWM